MCPVYLPPPAPGELADDKLTVGILLLTPTYSGSQYSQRAYKQERGGFRPQSHILMLSSCFKYWLSNERA